MSDQQLSQEEKRQYPLKQQAGFAGGTFVTMALADVIAHLGPTGLFIGGLASYVAWKHGPEIYESVSHRVRGILPARAEETGQTEEPADSPIQQRKRSLLERAFGHYPEPVEEGREDSEKEREPGQSTLQADSIIGSDPARRLDLAPNFQPDANAPLATGVLAVGCQGSGKTVTLVCFVEQYVKRYGLPCVVFDSQGDWKSLVEDGFCPNGIIATPENIPSMQEVIAQRLQVVVDLAEWHEEGLVEMSWEQSALLMAQSIRDLMAIQKQIELVDRVPCLVVIDEVHLWVPQTAPSYLAKETAKTLLDAVIALSTTGRKLWVVPMLATQRIAKVNKDVIGSIETRIFGKADLDNDITRYREYISQSVVSDEQIRAFGQGEMVVCFSGQRILVQFKNRKTRHVSHNPRIPQSRSAQALLRTEELPQSTRTTYHSHDVGPDSVAKRRKARELLFHPQRNAETVSGNSLETHTGANGSTSKVVPFPFPETGETLTVSRADPPTSGVSGETKQIILRLHQEGMSLRKIAGIVNLAGGKYNRFKLACQELGIAPEQNTEII